MKRALLALAAALLLPALAAAAPKTAPPVIDLPQIGEPADRTMSPAQELAVGRKIVAELYSHAYVLEDPELSEYISALGWKLAAASQTKPQQLTFLMIADARINAFALPGGFIGVNAGLLLAASNESEVAGVLGHELAHVTQRHIARSQDGDEAATLATWAAVLAAIIAGSANPDVVIGALSVGQALTYQRQVNYTRAHEHEADRIGIQTMAGAGFDPEGMASFFVRLQQQSRLYGSGVPEILRTHPLNTSRIAEARARIAALPPVERTDPLDFSLMQARARVRAADTFSQAVEYFDAEIASGKDDAASHYGLSYALLERGQYEEALAALEPALGQHPRQANLNLLKGRILLAQRQTGPALAALERTLRLYPGYAPAIFAYADALMLSGKPEVARQVLISHEQVLGTRLQTYSLLAQAARDMKQHAEAAYQMATYLHLRGDAGSALSQIDAGLRIADLSKQERARLLARRQEIRDSLPKDWRPPSGSEPRG
jgi:beta-barrel assembly-enhancing protease